MALRVDAEGVTLGGQPLSHIPFAVLVPWSDIKSVDLWHHRTHYLGAGFTTKKPWFGLHRAPGTPALPRTANPALIRFLIGPLVKPGGTEEKALASRRIDLWSLDEQRLRAAVARHAPQIQVRTSPGFGGRPARTT